MPADPRAAPRVNGDAASVPETSIATANSIVPADNTTNFAFWPQDDASQVRLPSDGDLKFNRQWFNSALLHPEQNNYQWSGACELGKGVSGQVGVWVKLDPFGVVIDDGGDSGTLPLARLLTVGGCLYLSAGRQRKGLECR
ncbi:hypothetical protein BU25DRAFT_37519 [Macroventuria anomochaeta]|uniref:Uncharacterized protein n=1 Tax=Macroventuria anomochaeta TaxID=301207 RepID=A0ACB6S2P2_9PLEO|nr:uncharacterized protein BU25DRAFT_37519 [Macroventuria anomochaeta]KAF2628515.1 hypothetical protein BU25DRAFT_37519 [Macroventuria anomochaeta]